MNFFPHLKRGKVQYKSLRVPAMHLLRIMVYAVLACSRIYASGGYRSADAPLMFLGNQSLPPMIFVENGKPAGIVVELAEAMAKRMKSPVKFEYMNWTTAQQLVLAGRTDALLQINPTEERK